MNKISFTSASEFPAKIFLNMQPEDKIKPLHLQFCPTNKCNLKCKFCSCGERDKTLELPLIECIAILFKFYKLGTKAITITGGGEPLMHRYMHRIIDALEKMNIKIGLVTNGFLLPVIKSRIEKIRWIRVSMAGDRNTSKLEKELDKVVDKQTDWAFSYVLTDKDNLKNLIWAVKYANKHNFTHVRIVPDLLQNYNDCDILEKARLKLVRAKVNDEKVIYQRRDKYTLGAKRCLISLLKPIVAADGMVYPCCGSQYSKTRNAKDFPENMKMAHYSDMARLTQEQECFDGSHCVRCYYSLYNETLESIKTVKHVGHV